MIAFSFGGRVVPNRLVFVGKALGIESVKMIKVKSSLREKVFLPLSPVLRHREHAIEDRELRCLSQREVE